MWIFHFTIHFPALNKEVKWECVPSFKLSSFTVRLFASWLLRCGQENLTKWKQQPPLVSFTSRGEQFSNCCFAALLSFASQLHYPWMTNTQCYFGWSAKLQESVGRRIKTHTNDSLPGLVHKSSARNKQCVSKASLCSDKITSAFLQIQPKNLCFDLKLQVILCDWFCSFYFSLFLCLFLMIAHLFLTRQVFSVILINSNQMFVS